MPEDVTPPQPHPARGGPRQAADEGHQGRLARPARAAQHRGAVGLQVEGDAAHGPQLIVLALVVSLAHVGQLDHGSLPARACRFRRRVAGS